MTSEQNKPIPARRLPNGECSEGHLPSREGAYVIRGRGLQWQQRYPIGFRRSRTTLHSKEYTRRKLGRKQEDRRFDSDPTRFFSSNVGYSSPSSTTHKRPYKCLPPFGNTLARLGQHHKCQRYPKSPDDSISIESASSILGGRLYKTEISQCGSARPIELARSKFGFREWGTSPIPMSLLEVLASKLCRNWWIHMSESFLLSSPVFIC